jgi:hypothetical protein
MDDGFGVTRQGLHRVAEHVLAAARYAETGRIGLQVIVGGFSTGIFGPDRKAVSVVEDRLIVQQGREERSAKLTSLGAAADLAGVRAPIPETVYRPSTDPDPESPLSIDPETAARIEAWYREVSQALRTFPSVPQTLWPEHFDVAIRVNEVNYGGLAGDETIAEPYVYVGPPPTISRQGGFWNQPFGAVRTWSEVRTAAEISEFFAEGRRRAHQNVRATESV